MVGVWTSAQLCAQIPSLEIFNPLVTPLGLARWQARTRFDILFVDNKAVVCKMSVSSFQHSLLKVGSFYVSLLVSHFLPFLPFGCRWTRPVNHFGVVVGLFTVRALVTPTALLNSTTIFFLNNVVWLIQSRKRQTTFGNTNTLFNLLLGRSGRRARRYRAFSSQMSKW